MRKIAKMLRKRKRDREYPVEISRGSSNYGDEVYYGLPDSKHPAIVSQDVFGEKEAHMQLLIFSAETDTGDVADAVSVRFNNDGQIAEVVIPTHLERNVFPWDCAEETKWLKARDG